MHAGRERPFDPALSDPTPTRKGKLKDERNLHEQFGDGIMRAINFSVDIQKKPHPAGDRVVVTFDGRFLPYDWTAAEG